jgi:hypothetical protein
MCPKLYKKLVEYCQKNKGDTNFMSLSDEDMEDKILEHLIEDTCYFEYEDYEIIGVIFWSVIKYLPMEILINEAICNNNQILADLLEKLSSITPPAVRCFAYRKGGTRKVEYKNPRRIIQKIRRSYGRPSNSKTVKISSFNSQGTQD